jgi:hypothetical protein
MEKILLAQFIAHIVADFFLQPECVCEGKQKHVFNSWHAYVHALIVFATSVALTFTCEFVFWACWIAVSHLVVDAVKCSVGRSGKIKSGWALFFADQILHFAVIWVAVVLYAKCGGTAPGYVDCFTVRQLLAVLGLLLCLKPANVAIQMCFQLLKADKVIAASLEDKGLQKAGHWIGSMERAMTFVLFLLGHYTVIGFIIGAKSILRYAEKGRAEYVLVGTLMSFGVAFALGVGITSGVFEKVINVISII